MRKKILLVAGHESRSVLNKFPLVGAVLKKIGYLYTWEQREVMHIVAKAYIELKELGYDVKVCPFQYNLGKKIKWANKIGTINDVLISVHLNSNPNPAVTGSEVWFYSGNDWSEKTAKKLAEIVSETIGLRNRGEKGDKANDHKRLGIIRDTEPAAFLLELGFMSNPEDLWLIRKTDNYGLKGGVNAVINCVKYLSNEK